MNRYFQSVWCACLIVALSGCLNIDETYTINPDGTGKVVHKSVLPLLDLNLPGQESDPERRMKALVKDELEKAEGVDAWTDVSFSRTGTDKLMFQGTAYFKDITALKFHNGGTTINLFDRLEIASQNGQGVLTVLSSGQEEEPPPADAAPDLSEEDVVRQIEQVHTDMDKVKMMLAGIFSEMKTTRTFLLPGPVLKAMNLEQPAEHQVRFSFSGEKLIAVMESFMGDDEWLRSEILAGRNPLKDKPADDNILNERLFGQNAPVKAIYETGTPQFDYAEEVAAARGVQQAVLKDLGVMPKKQLDAAPGGFRVGGVRLVYFSDMDNEVRSFNYDEGYTLSIVGDLPPKVIKVTGGTLKVARAEKDVNLLPQKDWDKNINFPNMSKDKKVMVFEVNLRIPPAGVTAIKEISGVLEYIVASGVEEEDLKITDFKPGTGGAEFGAKIKDIKESEWGDGQQQMDLELNLSPERVKSARILDEDGRELEVSQGYTSFGTETTYHFTLREGVFPETGRIIMEVYQDPEKYEMPFKIENISVSGRPL